MLPQDDNGSVRGDLCMYEYNQHQTVEIFTTVLSLP